METVDEKHVAITFNSVSPEIIIFTTTRKVIVYDSFIISKDDPVLKMCAEALEIDVAMIVETLESFYKKARFPIERRE